MSGIAIRADSLSKLYHIGQGATPRFRYRSLRDTIMNTFMTPIRWINSPKGNRKDENTIWALKDVSFEINQGDAVGVIGRNGAGKSTLLKILSRITEPTSGIVDLYGRVGSLLEVGTGFHPELTGRENLFLNGAILGMRKAEIHHKFDEIVDFAEIEKFIDTPVKHYSSGMYVRLAFAVAAYLEPEILLVDEVLAVGDAEFQKKCLGKMGEVTKTGRTVLFVSHNMEAILNLCLACIVIENGHIVYSGKPEDAIKYYLGSISKMKSQLAAHVLYDDKQGSSNQSTKILRVEMLEASCQPKGYVYTWDDLIFRIHYFSEREYQRGSFRLEVFDQKQQRLLNFDSGLSFPIESGLHYIDCIIPCFPLSAGEYFLGAGLTVSNHQWLWRKENLTSFQVYGKDVFNLGRPPRYSGAFFAIPHEWQHESNLGSR